MAVFGSAWSDNSVQYVYPTREKVKKWGDEEEEEEEEEEEASRTSIANEGENLVSDTEHGTVKYRSKSNMVRVSQARK